MTVFPRFSLLLLLALTALCAWGCGQDQTLDRARAALNRGQLDRAEALIAGSSGADYDALEAAIFAQRRLRASTEETIAAAFERLRGGDRRAVDELEALKKESGNPWVRERLAQAVSEAVDVAAALRRSKPMPKRSSGGSDAPLAAESPEPAKPQVDEFAASLLADVQPLIDQGLWARARGELDRLRADFDEPVPVFERAWLDLSESMREDVLEVLDQVRREESLRGKGAAIAYLQGELERFPRAGSGLDVHERWTALGGDVSTPAGGTQNDRAQVSQAHTSPDVPAETEPIYGDPRKLALEASRQAGAGDLQRAGELWWIAALGSVGEEALRYRVRGRDAAGRAALRAALVEGEDSARLPGWTAADTAGVVWEGKRIAWPDLSAEQLIAMAEAAGAADSEGLTLELLALIDGSGAGEASQRLQAAWQAGDWTTAERDELLALHRGASSGTAFRFENGLFRPALEVEAAQLGPAYEASLDLLEGGGPEERDAAWSELAELALSHRAAATGLRGAIAERLQNVGARAQKATELGRLQRLADSRNLLDRLRGKALETIEDEDRYFYPYVIREVGAERYAAYVAVQREVDATIESISKLWNRSEPAIPLSAGFRAQLADLRWCLERLRELEHPAPLPPGLPSWVEGLDPRLEAVGLRDFAWSREELEELVLWGRIEAESIRRYGVYGSARNLDGSEREMVALTNGYRRMLGRRPLAWSPNLQGAASRHSGYMADTGELGHIENSAYPTPGDRLAAEGYRGSGGENCYAGETTPGSAHKSWVRSSSHHRNLVHEGFTEIGAALHGAYWTQVFGRDTTWLIRLGR